MHSKMDGATTKGSKNGGVSMSEEERREKIRQGLILKKECDRKALAVVEKLLDPVDREWFRSAAFYLNASYYNDVVEERGCIDICGYPLCQKEVKKKSQKYHISTRHNKVFDITERKKFCSNTCFKSSEYYKEQILTSPLWLREPSDQDPVVFYDEINNREQPKVTSSQGTEVEFFKTVLTEEIEGKRDAHGDVRKGPSEPSGEDVSFLSDKLDRLKMDSFASDASAYKPCTSTVHRDKSGTNDSKNSLAKVEKFLEEWFTIDTYRLLRGDDYVRQVLVENECTVENVVAAVGVEQPQQTFEFRSKYIQLCRNLDLRDLEDDAEDQEAMDGGTSEAGGGDGDPFVRMRLEAAVERLKIASYLRGKTEYEQEEEPKNKIKEVGNIREREEAAAAEPRIPLVDKYAQEALRRRVVHEQLDRVLPDLLQLLGILRRDINEALAKFVFSLALTAENIVLKPEEWTLAAIFLLKMISFQDPRTRGSMKSQASSKYLKMVLLSYGVNGEDYIEEKIETFHSNIHSLLFKLKKPTI